MPDKTKDKAIEDAGKATESLTGQLNKIQDAWYAANSSPSVSANNSWVAEVFEEYVIVEQAGKYYQVPYSETDGNIVFATVGEWQEVERKVEWATKSLQAQIKRTGHNTLKSIRVTDDELVVANYMVLFGDENSRDLEFLRSGPNPDGSMGEYFSKNTNFESAYTEVGTLYVDWEHGRGKQVDGLGPDVDDVLGVVNWKTAVIDDTGVWVERILNRRKKYVQMLESLIDEGLIGSSSQAVPGKTIVNKNGEIEKWPLYRDTLTVMPAEPRMMSDNVVAALKSLAKDFPKLQALLPQEGGEPSSASATPAEEPMSKSTKSIQVKEVHMNPKDKLLQDFCKTMGIEDVDSLTEEQKALAFKGTEFEVKSPEQRMDAMEAQLMALNENVTKALKYAEDAPPIKNAGYISQTGGKSDKNVKSFGDFLTAIARKDAVRLKAIYGSFYQEEDDAKAMSEGSGTAGGYVVPVEYENMLMQLAADQSVIRNMATVLPVGAPTGYIPVLDQYTAPTAGAGNTAYAGGIVATPVAEAGALTSTDLVLDQVHWHVNKAGGYTYASNELIEDSPMALETILSVNFALAIRAKEDRQFFRGTGVGEALGILTSAAAIGITPDANNVWDEGDALEMLSRFKPYLNKTAWFIHPGIIPDLGEFEMGTGGSVYIQNIAGDNPTGMPLMGKPVYQSEHLPQDDNSGCVILADLSAYVIFDRRGMTIDFSEHYRFINDQGTWRFTKRFDGKPWVTSTVTLADPQGSFTVSPFVYFND